MFLETAVIKPAADVVLVTLPGADTDTEGSLSTIYAGLRFDSNGSVYERTASGVWVNTGAWLLDGAASDYYLWRTLDGGTLTQDDGDGNQLNTDDLDYYIATSTPWFRRITIVTFSISDDSGGSNILATRQYTFQAYREGTGTPP